MSPKRNHYSTNRNHPSTVKHLQDKDGNTPLKLAQNASYPNHHEVAQQIASFIMKKGLHLNHTSITSSAAADKYVCTSPLNKVQTMSNGTNKFRYNSPLLMRQSFDEELTMDSNMMGLDKSDRHGMDPSGRINVVSSTPGRNHNMVSFGDLLEDEEREENNEMNGNHVGGEEVRESIEISLGGNGR